MKTNEEDLLIQLSLLGAIYCLGDMANEDSMEEVADALYSYTKVKNLGVRGLADHMVINGFPIETAIELFKTNGMVWDTIEH